MNNLLSSGSFEAVRRCKDREQRITRWYDGWMTQSEPLYELFEDEPVTGMKAHAWYQLDEYCNFGVMESNLGFTQHSTDKIGCFRNYWDYKYCAECKNYAESVDVGAIVYDGENRYWSKKTFYNAAIVIDVCII